VRGGGGSRRWPPEWPSSGSVNSAESDAFTVLRVNKSSRELSGEGETVPTPDGRQGEPAVRAKAEASRCVILGGIPSRRDLEEICVRTDASHDESLGNSAERSAEIVERIRQDLLRLACLGPLSIRPRRSLPAVLASLSML
jgi:hypothetical protein